MDPEKDHHEEVEVVGEYDDEIEEMVREAKSDESYFDDPDSTEETRTRRARMMRSDPVMSRAVDADLEDFEDFNVDDDEFTTRLETVEESLTKLGAEYTSIEIGSETYRQLVETGELDEDDVSVFYISGGDFSSELLGEIEDPDTEEAQSNVMLMYGDSGIEDTIPINVDEVDDMSLSVPQTDCYRRNKPELE